MKKGLILIISILISASFSFAQQKNKKLEEFVVDLSYSNNKLRGELKLFGAYKEDFSSLTFDYYVQMLKKNEVESNKGISDIIKNSDKHLFKANKNAFILAMYSKNLNAVIYDSSNTAFVDSIIELREGNNIPELETLFKKIGFKDK